MHIIHYYFLLLINILGYFNSKIQFPWVRMKVKVYLLSCYSLICYQIICCFYVSRELFSWSLILNFIIENRNINPRKYCQITWDKKWIHCEYISWYISFIYMVNIIIYFNKFIFIIIYSYRISNFNKTDWINIICDTYLQEILLK